MEYHFADCVLDTQLRTLHRRGQRLRLTPKVFAVLLYLIEHRDRVVSKQELCEQVWQGLAISDATLESCVHSVRLRVGDSGRQQRLIETSRGYGYRFVAEMHPPAESAVTPASEAADATFPTPRAPQTVVAAHGEGRPGLRVDGSSLQDHPEETTCSTADGIRDRPVPTTLSPLRPPGDLFGRSSEFEQLAGGLRRAWAGTRQLIMVTGEPGIGKTTLVQAFVQAAQAWPGLWVGRGQCVEHYGDGEAYLPILEAFGRLGRQADCKPLVQILGRYAPTWLAQMPGLVAPQARAALLTSVQGVTQQRMLREIAEALEVLTEQQALLLWFEDLQWSDVSTLQLLAWLALRPGPARLLVLGTLRPVEVERPLARIVQDVHLKGYCQEVPLRPLSEAAMSAYLSRRGAAALHLAPQRLASAIYRRTEGNPLFMVHVVDYLEAQDWLGEGTPQRLDAKLDTFLEQIPTNIYRMVETQIACLTPEEQRLLEVASVAGAEFSTALVAAGSALDIEEVEEGLAGLARRTHFLQARGTVSLPDKTLATGYRFCHAIYQEVLYQRLAGRRRVILHRHIGAWQERLYGEHTAEVAPELAIHFTQGHDFQRALSYRRQAAETAMRRSAYQEAMTHLTKGLEALQELPATPASLYQELLLRTSLGAALAATKGYAATEVQTAYAQAQALCRQVPESPQLFLVLFGLWGFHLVRGTLRMAQDLGEQLLSLAHQSQEPALLVVAQGAMGVTLFHLGEFVSARTYLERGLDLYDPHQHSALALRYGQDPGVACRAILGQTLWLLGYPEQALQVGHAALKHARELSHPFSLAFALNGVITIHLCRREGEAAQKQAETSLTLCREQGFPFWESGSMLLLGWALAEQGQQAAGLSQMREGLAARRAIGSGIGLPMFLAALAPASPQQTMEGLAVLDEALAVVETNGERRFEAELYRLKAQLTLHHCPTPRTARPATPQHSSSQPLYGGAEVTAEADLRTSLAIARRQQAKSLELRSAIDLSRLWQQQGKRTEARHLLADIYHWFTEGFDTTDLQAAKALLEALQ